MLHSVMRVRHGDAAPASDRELPRAWRACGCRPRASKQNGAQANRHFIWHFATRAHQKPSLARPPSQAAIAEEKKAIEKPQDKQRRQCSTLSCVLLREPISKHGAENVPLISPIPSGGSRSKGTRHSPETLHLPVTHGAMEPRSYRKPEAETSHPTRSEAQLVKSSRKSSLSTRLAHHGRVASEIQQRRDLRKQLAEASGQPSKFECRTTATLLAAASALKASKNCAKTALPFERGCMHDGGVAVDVLKRSVKCCSPSHLFETFAGLCGRIGPRHQQHAGHLFPNQPKDWIIDFG